MGVIRPSYNNWSSGAITPKLYGQPDSPLYISGLAEMKNMVPELFGSAKRRGGLKAIVNLNDQGITGECRLIPWSVSKDIDLIVILYDGGLNMIDVSYNHDIGIVECGTVNALFPFENFSWESFSGILADNSATIASVAGIEVEARHVGKTVVGANVPPYAKVQSVDTVARTITLDTATSDTDPDSTCYNFSINSGGGTLYDSEEIWEVSYATSIRSIYFAHKEKPLLRISFINYTPPDEASEEPGKFAFEIGPVDLSGSIAYTPEIGTIECIPGTDSVSTSEDINYRFGSMAIGEVFNFPVGTKMDGRPLTSVTVGSVNTPESFNMYSCRPTGSPYINANYVAGGATGSIDFSMPTVTLFGITAGTLWSIAESSMSESKWTFPQTILPYPLVMLLLRTWNLIDGNTYSLVAQRSPLLGGRLATGTVKYTAATAKRKYIFHFSDAGADQEVQPYDGQVFVFTFTTTTPGVPNEEVAVLGSSLIDYVAAWMETGLTYHCVPGAPYGGIYPRTCRKADGSLVFDPLTGQLIGTNEFHLVINGPTTPAGTDYKDQIIYRDDTTSGQLGVIVNPFFGANRYPGIVAFHQNRMVLGASIAEPNVLYLSKTNDYTNFCYFEEIEYEKNTIRPKPWTNPNIPEYDVTKAITQQIGQDSAMRLKLMTEESEAINWVVTIGDLVIGTATSEWVIPKDVTALNPVAIMTSRNGSCSVQGRFVKGSVLFASANANAMKMFQGSVGEVTDAITDHAEHLFRSNGAKIQSFDFRQDPYHGILVQMDDGRVILGVINAQSIGWCEFITGEGTIESACSIQAYEEDALYVVALRDGVRYFERLMTTDDATSSYLDRVYLDSWEQHTTSGANEITGLGRFYGKECAVVFADGQAGTPVIAAVTFTCSTFIDSDGVTTNNPASTACVIGFRYESVMKTLRIDSGQMEGLQKNPASFTLRLYRSGDLWVKRERDIGTTLEDSSAVRLYTPAMPDDPLGARQYPYTGNIRVENPNGNSDEQSLYLCTDSHEPLTVQMIVPTYNVGEEP